MDLVSTPSFPLVVFLFVIAIVTILAWLVYHKGVKRRQVAVVSFGCKNCGSNKLARIDAGSQRLFQCKSCGAGFSDPVEQFMLEEDADEKDPERKVKDRVCPHCGSNQIYPDQVAGSIITWTCKKCGSTFPSAIEIYQKTRK